MQSDSLILLMPEFLSLGIDIKAEIIDQLEGGLLCIQVKHLLNKVDHIRGIKKNTTREGQIIDLFGYENNESFFILIELTGKSK